MFDLDNKVTRGGSPEQRRGRSGSDDPIQRQSIGRLELNNNLGANEEGTKQIPA